MKLKIVSLLTLLVTGAALGAASEKTTTFAEYSSLSAEQTAKNNQLKDLEFQIQQQEQERDLAKAKAEAIEAKRQLLLVENGAVTSKGENASTQSANEEKISEFDKYIQQANELVRELEQKVYLVDLYSIAGKTRGKVLFGGSSAPVEKGTIISGKWRVKHIDMNGITLQNLNPKSSESVEQFVPLKSETEALDSITQALAFKKQMIEARIEAAQQNAFNAATLAPVMNDSPTPGLMYE